MKKLLFTLCRAILFFTCSMAAVSLILWKWDRPDIVADNPSLLRLYWEIVPLAVVLAATAVFSNGKGRATTPLRFLRRPIHDTIVGCIWGALWIGVSLGLLYMLHVVKLGEKNSIDSLWIWVLALGINVIMQELLVRGYLFRLIYSRYNATSAVLLTTALFIAMHAGAFQAGWVAAANVATTGILLSFVLLYTQSLWTTIIVHFTWNFVGGLLTNGIILAADYPNLYQLTMEGSKWLTGGAAKIEGSIVVLLINIVVIMLLSFLLYRTSNRRMPNYHLRSKKKKALKERYEKALRL